MAHTTRDEDPADTTVIREVVEAAYALLEEHGFKPVEYHISERYRVCMEVIAVKQGGGGMGSGPFWEARVFEPEPSYAIEQMPN